MTAPTRLLFLLITIVLLAYVGCLVALLSYQRQLVFLPEKMAPTAMPASYGLPGTRDLSIRTADGETLGARYKPAGVDGNFFLVFHGTGGNLGSLSGLLRNLSANGSGFLAIDYRGYGKSTGTPTEPGLLRDGQAAYAEARRLGYAQNRIVVLGESLGTFVAVAVAAAHPPRALVLDSAFSSAVDIAASRYWMFPISLMMLDRMDSQRLIPYVVAPKLFIHGKKDEAISPAFGRKLYDRASEPKTFLMLPDAGHLALWRPEVLDQMNNWLFGL